MKKDAQRLYRFLFLGLLGFNVFLLAAILVTGIQAPANNLIPWQMAVGTLAGTALLIAAFILWDKVISSRFPKIGDFCPVLVLVYGVFLYMLSAIHRNSPYSFVDYSVVYGSAMELAKDESISQAAYFLIYPNNFKLVLYLGAIFKAAFRLGFSDPYYFALGIGVLQVMFAAWATDYLLRSMKGYEKYRFPALMTYLCLLPIYANVQAFYTDQMSFWQAVCMLALMRWAYENYAERKKTALFVAGAAGVIGAFGMTVKVTMMIPLIAAGMLLVILGRERKKYILGVVLFFFLSITMLFTEMWADRYDFYQQAKETGNPILSWVAIGMTGQGDFGEDIEYSHTLNALPTKAEKTAYTKAYITEHFDRFFDPDHIWAKLNCNFADGSLGTKDFTYYGEVPDNLVYEIFSPWGKYYWRSQQFCFIYLFMMYLTYFIGAAVGIVLLFRKKAVHWSIFFVHLDLLGNILFLMLWEANNRQLYNQMPVLLLGWSCNLILIKDFVLGLRQECREER